VLEDVSEEHARKTITVDPFPHSSVVAASIHPCKHAPVMKKLGEMAEAGGKEFRVEK
jgi:ubiquitin-like-conjugating enzyme ATG3